jgi:hypothetical protein
MSSKFMRVFTAIITLLITQIPAGAQQRAENGTATGQLKNSSGAPAGGVRVAAMSLAEGNTQGGGALVSLAETDAQGRYRLENIPPGRYYIQAGFIDAPSYYPGVSTVARASDVQIAAGATVTGLDFTMATGAGVRVSGRVPLTITPRPVAIRLIGGIARPGAQNQITIGADGAFEFTRVPPGNYNLMVTPANALLPNVPIVVSDKDVTVGLPAGPGVKLSGVVGMGPNSPRTPNQRVVLTGSTAWSQVETVVGPTGEFEFPSVPAGSYGVRTIPGPTAEISRVTVADREVRGIVVPALVQISGRVILEDGGAIPASPVAVMVEAARPNATIATPIGRDGAFNLPLGEGDYRISLGRLPPGVSVKSISYGASDLLANPLKLDGTSAPTEIRLTLQKN